MRPSAGRKERGMAWESREVKKTDEERESEIMEWLSRKITVIYPVYMRQD